MSKNLVLTSPLSDLVRRDFPLYDPLIIQPNNVRPLVDGEWLELDSTVKAKRGGNNNASDADEGTVPAYAVHTERGRYDMQGIKMADLLFLGMFEARTKIFDNTALAVGDLLTVQDITVGSDTTVRRGLKKAGSTANRWVVGYCVKVDDGSSYMRFVRIPPMKYLT